MSETYKLPEQSSEFDAVKELKDPDMIRDYYKKLTKDLEVGTVAKHQFMALKDNQDMSVQAFWQISYALDTMQVTPETRKLWSEALGKDLILSQSTKEQDQEYFARIE